MIQGYKIKNNILYVEINFNDEFAKLNSKKKKKSLKKEIEQFIKDKKIAFTGTTVAIVASGMIIGSVVINNPNKQYIPLNTPSISVVADLNEEDIIKVNEEVKVTDVEEKIDVVEEKIGDINTTSSKPNTPSNTTTSSSVSKRTTSSENKGTSSNDTSSMKINEIEDTNTYVTIYRSNGNIEKIELEEYIIGVVAAEMPASFNTEALKSQAILARTYAIKSIQAGTKLTDTSSTQNYKDISGMKATWGSSYNTYYNKIKGAVDSTKGLYLTYNGNPIEAVYHSTSNGKTEDAENVWGNSFPYLISVSSPYDTTNKNYSYTTTLNYLDISAKLGVEVNQNIVIDILSRTAGDRVDKIEIAGKVFTGVEVRNLLGLRSADFTIELLDSGACITTRGYGHGVGMSQYGANGMAGNGSSYTQILNHYYPGTTLSKM